MNPATASNTESIRRRHAMVERQIAHRGISSPLVLDAMRSVEREAFLPEELREFTYDDTPLPIEAGQTITQPYIVALMTEALLLKGDETVLEIGTGSGYTAAVLSRIAKTVYSIESYGQLASQAAETLASEGFHNVHVLQGDGTLGWPEHSPFDAILVAAGGPEVPRSLKEQLKIGGRLVIPVGADRRLQELLRITRLSESDYTTEELLDVRFVPLIGEQGWAPERPDQQPQPSPPADRAVDRAVVDDREVARLIAAACEPFSDIDSVDLAPLLGRIGEARVVLIGEASHGTSEFYRMRARITRELIERKGFSFVAIEGDWPDAARVDHYVRHAETPPSEWTAFARFPTWMWRNGETRTFVDWLRAHNAAHEPAQRVAFRGLDLYSLYSSIRSVLDYLKDVDPQTAQVAQLRYGCLTPWEAEPATYGHAAITGSYRSCETPVVAVLKDLRRKEQVYAEHDGERFLDASQNALLVSNAEQYYRIMYYGSRASWNLRDGHMFDTLMNLLQHHGPESRGVVWAHNSHIGDASATEMSRRGEFNIGQLCRQQLGTAAYSIGFGTHDGTVAAATDSDGPMLTKSVRPSLEQSYERLCHESGAPQFLLPLRQPASQALCQALMKPRLERAIGVIYRPETELQSHYFQAVLPRQFDEYIWFDRTRAVTPFETAELKGMPDTYPFGL
ncbi:protein-L-isoaspartate(D-aspartate) O-methyltransferase [Synechococcus sp. J7-Johnson]|uniref:protein-L-isoaspartate(D-aspartate) O-methyltransferase n=1 Tax=Synechococcus sp. J7-Johnson TaxID=2823737 RepID=UPI0020CEC584|nr:protein-L-isoaspartate(D-aspartate) O-methyltransferase [Synechococcus sp. J7-Johnson]MCP9841759.1 protein-L-isoaspartate(D-aspartate) O-methyltransferase [Synechococcus sp. J7-Johnson]